MRYRVLLADDVADLRRLVRMGLEETGRFEIVAEAATGDEAIVHARNHQPDLVLLDLSMPGMDGLEALPKILEAAPSARVAVFSGFNHARMAPVALRLGAGVYLEKGIEPEELAAGLLALAQGGLPPSAEGPNDSGGLRERALCFLLLARSLEVSRAVVQAYPEAKVERVSSLRRAVSALQEKTPDVLIAEVAPQSEAAVADIVDLLGHAPQTALVLVLPDHNDEIAKRALALGAEECLRGNDLQPDIVRRVLRYAMERRRVQEERRQGREQAYALRRLTEIEAMKTRFLNTAAHELNTPLTPIMIQLHMLRESGASLGGEERHALGILERNFNRLASLTKQLLDVARLEADKVQPHPVAVELRGLVSVAVDSYLPMAEQRQTHLHLRVPATMPVSCDPQLVSQVLDNLLSNAIKYTPVGGNVVVSAETSDQEATVRVTDSGIGFTKEQAEHLFQPFSRLHEEQNLDATGTGLGLCVAKGIIEMHGGRMWGLSDGPGKGATFGFTLPLAQGNGPTHRRPPRPGAARLLLQGKVGTA